jgi:hypothetical protein
MARILPLILILILFGLAPAWGEPLLAPDQIMPTSEIKPGMIAVGKTVFHGTTIEEFHLEILGVAEKARGGSDVILARVLDGTLIERQSAIVAGMSGSPVYIGGRLIGAIAFSWPFAKEPLAGITPIADMLKVLAAASAPAKAPATASLGQPVVINGRRVNSIRILDASTPATPEAAESPGVLSLRPTGALFLAAGLSQRGLDRLREVVQPFGAEVTQGVGGSSQLAGTKLEAGSALGVQLIRGDFEATALGTVTCVIGDKVLAFGHPMMSMGDTDLTLTTAYIQGILPSYNMSMKMGIAGAPVGRISQDRLWAVAGITGQEANRIPISVEVTDTENGTTHSYKAEIARHRLLSPGLAGTVALSAVDRAWEHIGEGMAQVTVEIEDSQRTIRRSDSGYSSMDAAAAVTGELVGPLAGFMDNEFGSVQVKAIRVFARVSKAHKTARLTRVTVEPGTHKAGETLKLNVLLRPFKGSPVEKSLELKLPPDLPDGPLRIGVCGGNEAAQLRPMLGLAVRKAYNLDQVIDMYETAERGDEVVAFAALPSVGVAVEGRRVSAMPGYLTDSLDDARSSVIEPERDYAKASVPCEWIVAGRQVISVDIKGKPGVTRGRAQKAPPSGPPSGGVKKQPQQQSTGDEGDDGDLMAPAAMMPAAANAGAADSDEEPGKESEKKEKEKKEEPIGRKPSSFTHAKRSDYLPGKLDSIACDQDGVLTLGSQAKVVAKFDEPVASALLVRGGAEYVATAPGGRVRKLSPEGQVQQTWETGAVVVTCLAAGADGTILAGTAPGGRIISLSADGKVEDYFATGEDAVWAIAPAPGGGVCAGTGPNGKIFVASAPGQGRELCQLPCTGVYSLAMSGDLVYAGTGNGGLVYAVDAAGRARAAYESDEQLIASLAAGTGGDIYAGTAPDAAVVRLRPGRDAEQIAQPEGDNLSSLAASPKGLLYAVTAEDGVVYEMDPDRKVTRVLRKPESAQAIAVALDDQGTLYVVESNPATLIRLGSERVERGVFTSKPQEAAPGTRWGAMSSGVERPQGTSATFQTRSGDSADPDDHWSAWSAPSELGSIAPIASPPGRFLQYRIILSAQQPGVTPSVRDIQVNYLPPNREPSVTISAPKPAERIHEKSDIKWKGHDPDGDTLIYDLSQSADGGKTWQDIKKGVEGDTYSWDTSGLRDGAYLLRVVASDRPSNPGAAREDDARQLVWVDNTPPVVVALRSTLSVTAQKTAKFRGAAEDALSPLRGVDYRVDSGKWRAAAVEGLIGTQEVSFSVETEALTAGDHTVKVRAFDQAGNSAEDEMRVKVEAATPEPPKLETAKPAESKAGASATEKPGATSGAETLKPGATSGAEAPKADGGKTEGR